MKNKSEISNLTRTMQKSHDYEKTCILRFLHSMITLKLSKLFTSRESNMFEGVSRE